MGVVMPIANAAILILRFFARYGTKQFGVDDALILFAFVRNPLDHGWLWY